MRGGGSQIVLLWWLLWIGTTFIDRAVGALADTVTSFEGYRTMLAIEAVSLVASAVGAGLAVWIIRETERRIAARANPSMSATLVVPTAPATEPVSVSHSVRFCPTCGAPRTEGGAFCASCGRELPSAT